LDPRNEAYRLRYIPARLRAGLIAQSEMTTKPITIGLAGGVGSGKSSIARMFEKLGGQLIEADKIGHQVLNLPPVKKKLIEWYGQEIIGPNGRVDRKKAAEMSFSCDFNVRRLNGLTHPLIRKEILWQLRQSDKRAVIKIIDAPLLMETGLDKFCDYVIFVDASMKNRIQRVVESRKWDAREISRREGHQIPMGDKKARADFIINNNKSLETTKTYIKRIFQTITARQS